MAAKIAVALAVLPIIIYSYASGPDPGYTGAPGDNPNACTAIGCHVGTPLNGGGGSVQLTSSAGASYTPGQQQTFTVTITDSQAKVYGFQMTARIDSDPQHLQAGDFTAGTQQIVICADSSLKRSAGCPANFPLEFIEHSAPFRTNTIKVTWTAPATDVGTVTIYVAANAANGDANNTGDHIYTTHLQLCPGSPCGSTASPPAVSPGGVVSASAFSPQAGVAPGTWLEIYGTNLAQTRRSWAGSDFTGDTAPTMLDGVSVTIGGVSAYVDYINPGQVNVQVPDGIPIGQNVPLVVKTSGGQSSPYMLQTSDLAPALLAPAVAPFSDNGKQYVVAQRADLSFTGIPSNPAKPGDVITIYGIGFGRVTPDTPAGVIASGATQLVNPVTFQCGDTPGKLLYAGLTPQAVGLYQFNIMVPNASPGDHALTVQVGNVTLPQKLLISIGQ